MTASYLQTNGSMKIVSFNVNGLRAILQKNFINDFNNLNADIFSLNETKLSEVKETFNFTPEGYHIYYTNSKIRKGYSGVCVFTKKEPLSVWYGLLDHKYDDEGRVITLEYNDFYYLPSKSNTYFCLLLASSDEYDVIVNPKCELIYNATGFVYRQCLEHFFTLRELIN